MVVSHSVYTALCIVHKKISDVIISHFYHIIEYDFHNLLGQTSVLFH